MIKKFLFLSLLLFWGSGASGQCIFPIPPNAAIINSTQTINGGFTPAWVCSNDTLHSDGGIFHVYLEPGAVMTTGGGIDTIYVKSGAHLYMNGGIHVIFYVNLGDLSIAGGIPYYFPCTSINFDYTNAPPGGCAFVPCNLTASINPAGPVSLCSGQSANLQSVVSNGTGAISYLWTGGFTTPAIIVSTSGTRTLLVTDSAGCTATASVIVNVNPNPSAPVITASGSTNICSGDSVTLSGNAGYSSYLWSDGNNSFSTTVSIQGIDTLFVTNVFGCIAFASIAVNVSPPPVTPNITPSGPITFCPGGSVTLNAGSGYSSYTWSTGESSQTIVVTSSGIFTVTVSNALGCTAFSTPITVTVYPTPNVIINPGNSSVCKDSSLTFTASGANTYSWQPGFQTGNTFTISPVNNTQIIVTGTDLNSCIASDTVMLNVYPVPVTPTISQNGNILTALPAGSYYQWYQNGNAIPGANSQVYFALLPGNYTVVVTDSNGCISPPSGPFIFTEVESILESRIRIYPNPTEGDLYLDLGQSISQNLKFELLDLSGRSCFTQIVSESFTVIKLRTLPKGIYLINVEGRILEKLIIQ